MPIKIRKRPGYLRWTAAGSFTAVSLAQYFINQISNGGGGSILLPNGYGGGPWSFPTPGSPGTSAETAPVIANKAIIHDINYGLYYTNTLAEPEPKWLLWDNGLWSSQYQKINKIEICPNGSIYVGYISNAPTDIFLAKAPILGGEFATLEDQTSMEAKTGSLPNSTYFEDFAINPSAAEQVLCLYSNNNIHQFVYIGANAAFAAGADYSIDARGASVSFGANQWMVMAEGGGATVYRLKISADGSSILASDAEFGYQVYRHKRLSAEGFTDATLHYGDGNLYLGVNDLTSYTTPNSSGTFPPIQGFSPDGSLILTQTVVAVPQKSSDGGATLTDVDTLPVSGNYAFDYIGGDGAASQWLGVSYDDGYVYYTDDFFESSPIDKRGNLLDLIPTPQLDLVKVILD